MSRPAGCLMMILFLLVALLALSILFGGFQNGTKVGGAPREVPTAPAMTAPRT